MSPALVALYERATRDDDEIRRPVHHTEGLILESWAQGFMVGALVFMACVTVANMRRKVLLHKLILAEVGSFEMCRCSSRCRMRLGADWFLNPGS
jgi:hypothetical protein